MGKFIRYASITILGLLVIGACLGMASFKLIQHRLASNLQRPHLESHPEDAADLVYRTLDGEPRRLSASKGQVVLLDLWGTWCVQCVAEMPTVQALYNHYRNDPEVKFLIVSRMDSSSAVRSYARRNHLDLPFFLTEDEDIPKSMQLNQFPATFLYARDGSLVAKHVGAADWSDPTVYRFIDDLKLEK